MVNESLTASTDGEHGKIRLDAEGIAINSQWKY